MMRKLFLLLVTAMFAVTSAVAVPAKHGVKKTITLADGSRVEAELKGDEHVNYYRTDDGRALQKVDGVYQVVDLQQLSVEHKRKMSARNQERALSHSKKIAYKGQKRGLVILVNFSDVKFTYSKEDFNNFFNQTGFNQCGMAGSVHDYFLEQSYGDFDLEFDVVGPVTVSHTAEYYSKQKTYPKRVPDMIYEICQKVDNQVDYTTYDWNDDGMVDQVFVIYAGYSAAQGAENTIWPHEWSLYAGSNGAYRTGEGVYVATYGMACELKGNGVDNTGILDGIGTACHEFSHCLGLPDFYDTRDVESSELNFGMSVWSLMDYGCYLDNGCTPSGYTAYERWYSGWLEPKELNSSMQVVNMPAIEEEPVAYIMYNDAQKNEYYLLANHQKKGFDAKQYGHGLLVTHVDYDEYAWVQNTVNNDGSRQRMTIIPADGSASTYSSNDLAGDPFPGTKRNRKLTDSSSPAATLYNANVDGRKLMGKPITEISEASGLISFNFMGGVTIDVPEVAAASNVSSTGFTANWNPIDGATSYTVALTATKNLSDEPEDNVLLDEQFSKCYTRMSNSSTDISSQLDSYTDIPGWAGSNLYRSPYYLRMGNTQNNGTLVSPIIEAPKRGGMTIIFSLLSAGSSSGTLNLTVAQPGGGTASTSISDIPVASSTSGKPAWLLPLDGWTAPMQLTLQANSPGIYVLRVSVFDGVYSWNDFEVPAQVKAFDTGLSMIEGSWTMVQDVSLLKAPRRTVESTTSYYTTTGTSYEFKNLEPAVYSYQVRATTDKGVSEWSKEVTVDLVTAVEAPSDVSQDATRRVAIYDATGRIVARPTKGLYISNGKKFLVK